MSHQPETPTQLVEPVERLDHDSRELQAEEDGVALCLSGGGYRAMLFHVGAIMRLNELGYLLKLDRISSVSGGSITASVLGMNWGKLAFNAAGVAQNLNEQFVMHVRAMASRTIDADSIIEGLILPGTVADKVRAAYEKYLFGGATLQDLPDKPRFVLNATNVQSMALCRFSKPYVWDYRVGKIANPTVSLAAAVGASSAFPPVLSPAQIHVNSADFVPNSGTDLQREPYTSELVLTDGGVYDNLGLETAWKRYSTILVSDGGGLTQPEPEPKKDWAQHSYRILNIVDNQVRSLRKRQIIQSFRSGLRNGAYWGIRTDIAEYQLADALPCPHEKTLRLATIATRLKRIDPAQQDELINWGYAVCDAAMRKHMNPGLPVPGGFPYPGSGV